MQTVRGATETIQAMIKAHHAQFVHDRKSFYQAVEQAVAPAFDLSYIAQVTLGRNWRSANEAQRTRFQSAFKNTLIHAYSDVLLDYSESSHVEWGRSSGDDAQASVRATVVRQAAPPISLSFELRRTEGAVWRAYDISVEGISLIGNFRSQFASEIKRDGLDALIDRLEQAQIGQPDRNVAPGEQQH